MIPETLRIIQQYNMQDITGPHAVDRSQRVPASTRIIAHICEIEKKDKAAGEMWMAELHEFAEWVRRDERKKHQGAK